MSNRILEEAQWHHSAGHQFNRAFYLLIAEFNVATKSWTEPIERPSYYCAGLAMEHFLKGYLTLEKIDYPRKGDKGHNLRGLISLHKRKIMNFFNLTDVDVAQIFLLNERYYNSKIYGKSDLRYGSKSGMRTSPHPDSLSGIVKMMDDMLMTRLQSEYLTLK